MARANPPKSNHPLQLSVSQIETFRLCPRKWAWQKIDGLDDPGNESAQLGQRVHDVAEKYFKFGTPLDMTTREARILMPGLAHLPPPMMPGMDVEKWFTVIIGPALFRGLKDLQMVGGWPSKRPWISDHKTTTSFEWAKSAEDLQENVQSGVYSYDLFDKYGEREFDLQWTYMRTSGTPFAQPVVTVLGYDPMMRIIEGVEETAREIELVKKSCETALDVPYNARGCGAFGGCRFKNNCNLSAQEELRSIMSQQSTHTSMIAKLTARKAAAASAAKSAPAAEPEEAAEESAAGAAPAAPSRLTALTRKKAERAAAPPAEAVEEESEDDEEDERGGAPDEAPAAKAKAVAAPAPSAGASRLAALTAKKKAAAEPPAKPPEKAPAEEPAEEPEAPAAEALAEQEPEVAINPPESPLAPSDEVVAARNEEKAKRGKKAAAPAALPPQTASQALGGLFTALAETILDDLATRIANKLKDSNGAK